MSELHQTETPVPAIPPLEAPFSLPTPSRQEPQRPRYLLALTLLLATLFTTSTLGAGWYLSTRTDVVTTLLPWMSPETVLNVWSHPALLSIGLSFALPVVLILLCHELGHYLACRIYKLPATLPYFLPAPLALGTLGAFIRIRAPIRSKKQLLDIGSAGPIAGFVALLPFLLYGVARSSIAPIHQPPIPELADALLLLPGRSLLLQLVSLAFHGPLPANTVLDLHPFALAAWVGLLATSLNLLPFGQLDGGHILYAVTGRLQRRLAPALWVLLAVAGLFWRGWWVWCLVALFLGLRHPPVVDESTPLDARRRWIALFSLLIFLLSFMPIPISVVPVSG